jgi:hypothetical protein
MKIKTLGLSMFPQPRRENWQTTHSPEQAQLLNRRLDHEHWYEYFARVILHLCIVVPTQSNRVELTTVVAHKGHPPWIRLLDWLKLLRFLIKALQDVALERGRLDGTARSVEVVSLTCMLLRYKFEKLSNLRLRNPSCIHGGWTTTATRNNI